MDLVNGLLDTVVPFWSFLWRWALVPGTALLFLGIIFWVLSKASGVKDDI